MLDAARYLVVEAMRDGRKLEIRALRPQDLTDLRAAVDRTSAQSLYRRFFGAKRSFSDKEVAFFVNVDFANHVALVAVVEERGHAAIVAGGRYIVQQPGTAEIAFIVVDEYQGQGIGSALLRHLAILARNAGLKEFAAEVLPENIPMLKTFEKSGLKMSTKREAGTVHVALELANPD
jgi:ribosomal protein S18 acetylase RimI-like enzyme